MQWLIGMLCWVQYCGPDRQYELKLCQIIGFHEYEYGDGITRRIAELRYSEPFMDVNELCEYTSVGVEHLDATWEIKNRQLIEINKVVLHNEMKLYE